MSVEKKDKKEENSYNLQTGHINREERYRPTSPDNLKNGNIREKSPEMEHSGTGIAANMTREVLHRENMPRESVNNLHRDPLYREALNKEPKEMARDGQREYYRDLPPRDGLPPRDILRDGGPRDGLPRDIARDLAPRDILPPRDGLPPRDIPRDLPPRDGLPPRDIPRDLPPRDGLPPREMSRDHLPRDMNREHSRDGTPQPFHNNQDRHYPPPYNMPPGEHPYRMPPRREPLPPNRNDMSFAREPHLKNESSSRVDSLMRPEHLARGEPIYNREAPKKPEFSSTRIYNDHSKDFQKDFIVNPKKKDDINLGDAMSFLETVKNNYANELSVYDSFLEVMRDYKHGKLDAAGVVRAATSLFKNKPELLEGFNDFLPVEYKVDRNYRRRVRMDGPMPRPPHLDRMPPNHITNDRLPENNRPGYPSVNERPLPERTFPENRAFQENRTFADNRAFQKKDEPKMMIERPRNESAFENLKSADQQLALNFIKKVKIKLKSLGTYRQFIDLLTEFQKTHDGCVMAKLHKILGKYPDLLEEFMTFIPKKEDSIIADIKKILEEKGIYEDFLKAFNLFNQKLMTPQDLVFLLRAFIKDEKMIDSFKRHLNEENSFFIEKKNLSIKNKFHSGQKPSDKKEDSKESNSSVENNQPIDNNLLGSYRICTNKQSQSNQDPISRQVLNNICYSYPLYASEGDEIIQSKKSAYMDTLFRLEDERYELELNLDRAEKLIESFEIFLMRTTNIDLENGIDVENGINLENAINLDKANLKETSCNDSDLRHSQENERPSNENAPEQSNENNAGQSNADEQEESSSSEEELDLTNLEMPAPLVNDIILGMYGEDGEDMFEELISKPRATIPVILKRMYKLIKCWKLEIREKEKIWKETVDKSFYKSLDHHLDFKSADKRYLNYKNFVKYLECDFFIGNILECQEDAINLLTEKYGEEQASELRSIISQDAFVKTDDSSQTVIIPLDIAARLRYFYLMVERLSEIKNLPIYKNILELIKDQLHNPLPDFEERMRAQSRALAYKLVTVERLIEKICKIEQSRRESTHSDDKYEIVLGDRLILTKIVVKKESQEIGHDSMAVLQNEPVDYGLIKDWPYLKRCQNSSDDSGHVFSFRIVPQLRENNQKIKYNENEIDYVFRKGFKREVKSNMRQHGDHV